MDIPKEAHDHSIDDTNSIRNEHTRSKINFRDRNRVHLAMVPHQETLGAIKDQLPFLFTKGSVIGFLLGASLPSCSRLPGSTCLGESHRVNVAGFLSFR